MHLKRSGAQGQVRISPKPSVPEIHRLTGNIAPLAHTRHSHHQRRGHTLQMRLSYYDDYLLQQR
jgi:hypothetical protein